MKGEGFMLPLATSHSNFPLPHLLQSLTEILHTPQALDMRLSLALKITAQEMDAEAAFLYLLTPNHYLEAFAAYDPTQYDRHHTRFRVGEGIVGFIASTAKSVLCDNISRHPNFFYSSGIPEQNEIAVLGIPLQTPRGILGVLTLQNPSSKPFQQNQEKALMAVCSFFSTLPDFDRFPILDKEEGKPEGMHVLRGVSFNSGIGVGTAVIHHSRTWKETAFSLNPKEESERLKMAIRDMIDSIDRLVSSSPNLEKNTQDVLASYRMIASDRGWVRKIQNYIQKGYTAEAAVQKVRRHTRERYGQIGDQVLKGRLSDFEDLASRLLKHLLGQDVVSEDLPESAILVAHNLGPAELLDYDRRFIKGVVLEEGVHTAHVAIVARALDIPVVGRIPRLLTHINSGDKLIVDGEEGTVTISPNTEALQEAREKMVQIKKNQALSKELQDKLCQTREGTPISLHLNAGLPIDLHHLEESQIEGVGLYRTEIPFMMRSSFPDVRIQTEIYRDVLEQAKEHPVTFRTLDIGGDKIVPYMWRVSDENPVLGWRGIRVVLDKPTILRQQVKALISASQGRELRLLFPLISDISEFLEARQCVLQEWDRFKEKETSLPTSLIFGVMLEVPSLVEQLEELLKEVDFVSIGTNDLFQFFYACDRTNPTVSARYDVLSTSFLKYLLKIRTNCEQANVSYSICGEMAAKPLEALALIALGYRSISVAGPSVGHLKKMILSLPLKEVEAFMKTALETHSPSLRSDLLGLVKQHQIKV